MMKFANFTLLTGVTTLTTGTAVNVGGYDRYTVSAYGTGGGAVFIQGSINAFWHNLVSGLLPTPSGGIYTGVSGPWLQFRAIASPSNTGIFYANARGSYF